MRKQSPRANGVHNNNIIFYNRTQCPGKGDWGAKRRSDGHKTSTKAEEQATDWGNKIETKLYNKFNNLSRRGEREEEYLQQHLRPAREQPELLLLLCGLSRNYRLLHTDTHTLTHTRNTRKLATASTKAVDADVDFDDHDEDGRELPAKGRQRYMKNSSSRVLILILKLMPSVSASTSCILTACAPIQVLVAATLQIESK